MGRLEMLSAARPDGAAQIQRSRPSHGPLGSVPSALARTGAAECPSVTPGTERSLLFHVSVWNVPVPPDLNDDGSALPRDELRRAGGDDMKLPAA
jgi:hypothetical protein